MSDSTDTTADDTTDAPAELPGDGLREGIVDALRADLGEHLLDTHLMPQTDLWVRVSPEAWQLTAQALKAQGFDYFCFLSAIDWMPSPYGKGEDDPDAEQEERDTEIRQGYAGGESRFQVFARLTDIKRHVGVTIKADVPDSMTMPTWIGSFSGANWHERETHEMFGIGFDGHPDLRNIYLPGEFEGHPLRKDFPLLARMIKPWPGIVDVEPMPEAAEDKADEPVPVPDDAPKSDDTAAGDAAEAATAPSTDAESPAANVDESADATTVTTPPTDATSTDDASADAADADAERVGDATEAADATPAADQPESAAASDDQADDEPASDDAAPEPAPGDASETARAETADDAGTTGDEPADLGPGTTTESTDADAAAPTPGRATEEHPDGLTGGDPDEERDA